MRQNPATRLWDEEEEGQRAAPEDRRQAISRFAQTRALLWAFLLCLELQVNACLLCDAF